MKYSVLLANNNRAKAYLQNLIKHGYPPAYAIVLMGDGTLRPENTAKDGNRPGQNNTENRKYSRDADISFDEGEHVLDTLEKHDIRYRQFSTFNVNAEEVVEAVGEAPGAYVVYAGPGATILRTPILRKKEIIHAHPGMLPQYRGSTTAYYSLLIDGSVGCSVILMREKIDAGPVLYSRKFEITEREIDFDYVLDPCVRTATLIDLFRHFERYTKDLRTQEKEAGNTFFIIHPVLKHLSILKTKGMYQERQVDDALNTVELA